MFNGVLGFIHQKLDQGLAAGDDIFNDAMGAVHHLFSGTPPPTSMAQPAQQNTLRVNNQPNTQSIAVNQAMNPTSISTVSQPSAPTKINLPAPANPNLPTLWNTPIARPSLLQQAETAGGSLVKPFLQADQLPVAAVRLGAANLTGNQQAANPARQQLVQGGRALVGIGQSVARTVPELVTSIVPQQHTYTPNTPITKALFGTTPIQNIEKKVASTYTSHPGGGAIPLAGGELIGSLLQDAPVAGAALKGAGLAIKGAKALDTAGASTAIKAGVSPEAGFAKIPGKNVNEPEILKHFTTPDVAQQLKGGASFDFSKAPQHGMGSLLPGEANGGAVGKFVSDGGPALYLSRDDTRWSTANVPTGKPTIVNIDNVKPEELKNLSAKGITPQYDYASQKYVGVKNATQKVPLKGVDYQIDPTARRLVLDSPQSLTRAAAETGKSLDNPEFWQALRQKYDVVDIKNVAKNINATPVDSMERNFFKSARADQSIVLNPDVATVKGSATKISQVAAKPVKISKADMKISKSGLPVGLERELTPKPPEPGTDMYAEMMDALGPPDFLRTSPNYKPKTPQELADLSPREQMALTKETPLNEPEVNTARNPFKSDIPEVKPGDYRQVVSNEQAAHLPVQFAGDRWRSAMANLTPEETTNFWRAVEKPEGDYSPQLKTAISAWRDVADRIHGTSQRLGGNTNYVTDYALHPWQLPEGFGDFVVNGGNPEKFAGINSVSRKHMTIEEGEKAGLQLGTDPLKEGQDFINASSAILRRRAIVKSLGEADGHIAKKDQVLDLGGGQAIPISKEAARAVRGLQKVRYSDNRLIKGARTGNVAFKSSLLSLGQFHPINISLLRAAPTLAIPKPSTLIYRSPEGAIRIDPTMSAHPVRAIKGVGKTFRPLLPGGSDFAEGVKARALKDGMVDKAARIGAPYGTGGFDTGGSAIKGGLGHNMVFNKQMVGMHDEVVRSVIGDLEKRGISLDSPEARTAGRAANNLMGFINKEAQNIPPVVKKAMNDYLLAGQFTPSKFTQIGTALTKGGVGGAYARANVAANVAASTAIIVGVGYLMGQKSDNIRDSLLRALVDPAAPTGNKDAKGNSVKERLPGTDTSDVAKLLGIKLVRNSDGHLGVSWNKHNLPNTVVDFARARLSPLASAGVKIKTNTTFAGKPLYDPNAKTGTKVAQAGTSIVQGILPIGLQGLPMTSPIENHLPQDVQQVLNAQKTGNNPLVKSVGSSFGFTPTTDTTTGKGLSSSRYFDAATHAKDGLTTQAANAVSRWTDSKKNPVTGAYDVMPNVNDSRAKATGLLDNPTALDNMIAMNQKLASEGEKVDPLWLQPKGNITKYLQYQAMPPGGPDQVNWRNQNPWYSQGDNSLINQRQAFFSSLPPGDPNKPNAPIEHPQASPQVQQLQKTYFSMTDPSQRAQFIQANPALQNQLDAQANYTNALRTAQGYGALRTYPKPNSYVQNLLNSMNGMSSAQKARVYADPQVAKWAEQDALYNVSKGFGLVQIQGNNPTSKDLKAVKSLGYDIMKNPDGTLSLKYQDSQGGFGGAPLQAGAVASGGSGSGRSKKKPLVPRPPRVTPKRVKISRPRKQRTGRPRLAKSNKSIKLKRTSGLRPLQVARPTQVLKIQA